MQIFLEQDIVDLLKIKQAEMTRRDFAKIVGVSETYLGDIYNLRRLPGPLVLRFLGLERGYWRKPA